MATQTSRDERLATADDVITNGASYEELQAQILTLHQRYVEMGRAH